MAPGEGCSHKGCERIETKFSTGTERTQKQRKFRFIDGQEQLRESIG